MQHSVYEIARELQRYGELRILHRDLMVVEVKRAKVRDTVRALQIFGARYSTSIGVDYRPVDGTYHVYHLFSVDNSKMYIAVKVRLPPAIPKAPSITPAIPAANWAEREIRDLLGIEFEEHPEPERLVLPTTWPEKAYPLRREYPFDGKHVPREIESDVRQTIETYRRYMVVPIGPYHPALHEPEYFELYIDGEKVVYARYRGFMVHRGIEKLAESKLTINQIPFIAERICGICGFTHSTAYCQAVEEALGIDVPERARYIRSILLEIERIHSHLLWFGVLLHLLGFDVGFMAMWRIREKIMDLAEMLTGNRKTYGMNLVGGVRRDIADDKKEFVKRVLDEVEKEFRDYVSKIIALDEIKARTRGVGVLTKSDAKKLGVVGPTARGSGLDIDTRRDHPYAAYDRVEFEVPVRDEGDVYARTIVRIEEVFESIKIVKQLLDDMPKTPIIVEEFEVRPLSIGLGYTEAPRGENVHFVITGKENRVYRWKVRAPSYNNIPATLTMLRDQYLADAPAIIASIDPCFSCTDRIVVVDLRNGKKIITKLSYLSRYSR